MLGSRRNKALNNKNLFYNMPSRARMPFLQTYYEKLRPCYISPEIAINKLPQVSALMHKLYDPFPQKMNISVIPSLGIIRQYYESMDWNLSANVSPEQLVRIARETLSFHFFTSSSSISLASI